MKTCFACKFSYMEPDSNVLICGHPDSGIFGTFIRKEPLSHCTNFKKFEQHPLRDNKGNLK